MKKNNQGFTLVETIVYIAIFAIVAGALVTFILNINSSRLHSQTMLEVKGHGADLMRTLTTAIKNATAINSPGTGSNSGVLSINTPDVTKNPTVFSANGEALFITEGVNTALALTNNKVKITNLTFTNLTRTGTKGVIQIRFKIQNTAQQTLPEQQYGIDFYGTATLR